MDRQKKLYRSRSDKMLAGVAGGLGDYLEVDSTIVRVVFVLLFFASAGIAAVIYIALVLIVPEEPMDKDRDLNDSTKAENDEKVVRDAEK